MIWKKIFYRAVSDGASKSLSASSLGIRLAARLASSGDGRICCINFDSKGRLISEKFVFPRWNDPEKLIRTVCLSVLSDSPKSAALALSVDSGCDDFEYIAALAEKTRKVLDENGVMLREFFLTDGLKYESLLNKEYV